MSTDHPEWRVERTEFLAAVSHELRTPLNSILGFANVLSNEIDGPLSPAQREDVEAIQSAGKHLMTLVSDVLDTSAESTAELEGFGPLPTDRVVTDVIRLFSPELRRKGLRVEIELPEGLPRPFTSARAVRQLLLNLVGNAVKYTREGVIRVRGHANERALIITVEDSGPGIHETARKKLFEPYTRATDDGEGWGLGLAIARDLASRIGALVEVRDVDGPGASFSLLLPREIGKPLSRMPSRPAHPAFSTRAHFVAAMSHELRTPLGSIVGFARLLEQGVDGPLTDAQRDSVVRIWRSSEELLVLLSDILDVAKIEAGKITLDQSAIEVEPVVHDAVARMKRTLDHDAPHVTLDLDEALPRVVADRARLAHAIGCVLRHVGRGRTSLVVRTRISKRETMASIRGERPVVRIEVHDPERAIDPAEAERAFEPFYELKESTGRRIMGLGLLLALARGLAQVQGGDVRCESTGNGTSWTMVFPAYP